MCTDNFVRTVVDTRRINTYVQRSTVFVYFTPPLLHCNIAYNNNIYVCRTVETNNIPFERVCYCLITERILSKSRNIARVRRVYISTRDIFYNDDIPIPTSYKPRLWLFLTRFVSVQCGLIQSIREELLLLPSRKDIIFYRTFLQNRYAYNHNNNILKYENTKMLR